MADEPNVHTHREAWLKAVARRLSPLFREWGHPLPFNIRMTCGFPSTRLLIGQKNQRIGECWHAQSSKDSHVEIMISPVLDDPMKVAGVLAHELIHAACGPDVGHKGPFRKIAKKLGLEGRMTATTEGAAFKQMMQPILDDIGPYPHAALNAAKRVRSEYKKQGTRLIKAECSDCGYTVRVTRKWVDDVGVPHCPEHGPMEVD